MTAGVERSSHQIGGVAAARFRSGAGADHVLVISHGLGGHGGLYDAFCAAHASRGVDVWTIDAPGHGRSCMAGPPGRFTMSEWVDALRDTAAYAAAITGLPVVVMGSSLGAAAAYGALAADAAYGGSIGAGVMMGIALPGSPRMPPNNPFRSDTYAAIEQLYGRALRLDVARLFDFDREYGYPDALEHKRSDPLNTWFYDLSSWASIFRFDPAVPLSANTQPMLYVVSDDDPRFPLDDVRRVVDATAGPVAEVVVRGGGHQLLITRISDVSDQVRHWCGEQLPSLTKDYVS
jgi:alpha-beta hydrolase superfamily lysophospholipase